MHSRRVDEPSLLNFDRIPRLLLTGFLIAGCAIALSLGMAARRPFILAAETRAENERIARRYMDLKYDNQQLETLAAEARTPEGLEREARRRGYQKENETRLTFLP